MSTDQSLLAGPPGVPRPVNPSPGKFLIILAALIFLAEMVSMLVLYFVQSPNYLANALFDGAMMLALILPGLYFLQLKPLSKQIEERNRAELELEQRNEELRILLQSETMARQSAETLKNAAQALSRTLNLEHVLQTLLDHLQEIVPSDTAGVNLLEDEAHLSVRAERGYHGWEGQKELPSFPMDGYTDSVLQRLKLTRKSLSIPNLEPDLGLKLNLGKENAGLLGHIRNWLIVPIFAGEKMIGLVEFGKTGSEAFNADQARWAEAMVGQAAIAVQNAWLFEQVRSSSTRLQSLAHRLVEIQEGERYHIARELHDEAGQSLSSLKIGLGQVEQDPECSPRLRLRLQALKTVADSVLEDLHRLAMDLRPGALDHLGLVAALEQVAHSIQTDDLSIDFKAVGFDESRLSQDVETALYRIVQEALTNIVRHAQASNVGILLDRSRGQVKVFIEDDGAGFTADLIDKGDHLGMVGMQERAEMLGGSLTIESTPGEGTTIIVEVPDGSSDSHHG